MSPRRAPARGKSADYLQPLVAALADPGVLAGIRPAELQPVAFQLALYFGFRREPATASALAGVYERLHRDGTEDDRRTLVRELAAAVRREATSVLALLPVLQHERDAGLVREAAFTFATRMPEAAGETLSGPRAIRALLDHTESAGVRAGLVGALLAIGDRRVAPILDGTWRLLDATGRDALLALPRERATLLEVEWLLGWLEDADPAAFTAVAELLAALPAAGEGRIVDLERELPALGEAGTVHELCAWSTVEAGERLAPRLRDLARRAAAPELLDGVRRAWGVGD
jgi:hypothetical protein